MKHTLILIFVLGGLLVGCAPSEAAIQTAIAETQQASLINQNGNIAIAQSPPTEALEQTFNDLEQYLKELFEVSTYSTIDPANFEIHQAQPVPLNKADELNGISEKWCLGIRWVRHDVEIDTFVQFEDIYLLTLNNGEWITESIFSFREGITIVENEKASWEACLLR